MGKKEVGAVFLFLVLSILVLGYFTNFKITGKTIQQIEKEKSGEKITEEIDKYGDARVFIKLKEPEKEEIRLFIKKQKTEQEIQEKIDKNIKEIAKKIGDNKIKHSFNDSLSALIEKSDLKDIIKNPEVESIKIVNFSKVLLQDTNSLINSSNTWNTSIDGVNIMGLHETVCVIDTGVDYNHSDLGGCFGENNETSSCKVIGGIDYCADETDCLTVDSDPKDVHGHGTHVTGIISSNGDISGVAPETKIISIKVCNSFGACPNDDIKAGIEWCTNNATKFNISSISISLGGGLYDNFCNDDFLASSINSAVKNNISVVIASGNDGSISQILSPACVQNATAVSSSTKTDAISSFSNRNFMVDLFAPGSFINSTCKGGGYCQKSGTSMSTPHVSGAFALLNQFIKKRYNRTGTVFETEETLKKTGKVIFDSSSNLNYSRIDIYSSLIELNKSLNVTIQSPENRTYNISQIPLNVTTNKETTIWLYSINNETNKTFTPNITINASSGENKLIVYANDSSGNRAEKNLSFFVDFVYPRIEYVNPTKENNTFTNKNNITIKVSVNETNEDTIIFGLFNSTQKIIENFSTNKTREINYTNLSDGEYYYNVSINDSVGNFNSTEIRLIYIDTKPPEIEIFSPINTTYTSRSVELNASANENVTFWYSINNKANITFILNTTIDVDVGDNNLILYANDSAGNVNKKEVFYSANFTIPQINLTSPENLSLFISDLQEIIFTYTIDETTNCSLLVNDEKIIENTIFDNSSEKSFIQAFEPGNYIWEITCTNSQNITGSSEVRYFEVVSPTTQPPSTSSGGGGGGGVVSGSVTKEVEDNITNGTVQQTGESLTANNETALENETIWEDAQNIPTGKVIGGEKQKSQNNIMIIIAVIVIILVIFIIIKKIWRHKNILNKK